MGVDGATDAGRKSGPAPEDFLAGFFDRSGAGSGTALENRILPDGARVLRALVGLPGGVTRGIQVTPAMRTFGRHCDARLGAPHVERKHGASPAEERRGAGADPAGLAPCRKTTVSHARGKAVAGLRRPSFQGMRGSSIAAFGRIVAVKKACPAAPLSIVQDPQPAKHRFRIRAGRPSGRWSVDKRRRTAFLGRLSLVAFGLILGALLTAPMTGWAGDADRERPRIDKLERQLDRMFESLEGYMKRDEDRELNGR